MSIYLIAEIGINASGSIDLAEQMILHAQQAGFDSVKLQKRTLEAVYTKEFLDSPRESPWGSTQRAQKEGLEFSLDDYKHIDDFCRHLGIAWSASAWDLGAQAFLQQFNLPWNKVASPMLGNKPLLRMIAAEKKRTFISTGMSTLDELDEVVRLFRDGGCPFQLLHCVSTYPMKEEDANLNCIPMLRERYQCEVGWSGHETCLTKVCVAAVALGAVTIERHVTLGRAMYGSDQAASIECHALRDFVETVRAVPAILGDGVKTIMAGEVAARAKLRVELP